MKLKRNLITLILSLLFSIIGIKTSAQYVEFNDKDNRFLVSKYSFSFIDKKAEIDTSNFSKHIKKFTQTKGEIINAGLISSPLWIKLDVVNNSEVDKLFLEIENSLLDQVSFYSYNESSGKLSLISEIGQKFKFSQRYIQHQHPILRLNIKKSESESVVIKIQNTDHTHVPLYISSEETTFHNLLNLDVINGLFSGLLLVMFLYNTFLFFITSERSYLYYIFYVGIIFLGQFIQTGYAFKYFWPNSPWLEQRSMAIISCLIGITAMLFMKVFLDLKTHMPKASKAINLFCFIYVGIILMACTSQLQFAHKLINSMSFTVLFTLIVSIIMAVRGFRVAKLFLIAWVLFLVGVIVFFMKDFGMVPYNHITTKMMQFGSAAEVVLLSIALGDFINKLKKEKVQSQKRELEAIKLNAKLIREQNALLELKVQERTADLNSTNEELSVTLENLKEAQTQLVESEKMASLGQLTAGIAHEINNPINFVSANVSPLRQDINDLLTILEQYENSETEDGISPEKVEIIQNYKDRIDFDFTLNEINTLLDGISDGAERTSEIVRGLKNFSRLDESEYNVVDINEGLESTFLILKSKSGQIKLNNELGDLEPIPCLPGKLNQLYMNIVDNAIHACLVKDYASDEKPTLTVRSAQDSDSTTITFIDNGIGMTPEIQARIFEPFFTTKKVGEGTGLGMSIVQGIIKSHEADIKIFSQINVGTEIIITLPRVTNNSIKHP